MTESLARRAAYLKLCAAQEQHIPTCSEEGPSWDQSPESVQVLACARCPIKRECRAYAESDPMNIWGIWGGQKYPRTAKGKISKGKVQS